MEIEIRDNELWVIIEKELYCSDVLYKCFYWYGADFGVDISNYSDKLFLVRMKSHSATQDWNKLIDKIKHDLVDFKLRDIVTKETKTIRELLVAKAFAYYGLKSDPSTEISDPVGFNPKSMGGDE